MTKQILSLELKARTENGYVKTLMGFAHIKKNHCDGIFKIGHCLKLGKFSIFPASSVILGYCLLCFVINFDCFY